MHAGGRLERDGRLTGEIVAVTDAEGRFAVRDLGPGTVSLAAEAEGYARVAPVEVAVPAAGEVRIVLPAGFAISGRVTGADGAAVAGAEVTATRDEASVVARSAPDGAFRISGLTAGTWRLAAAAEGVGASAVVEVKTGVDDAILSLSGRLAISGRVVDEDGNGVPDCQVVAWPEEGPVRNRPPTATPGPDGRFTLEVSGAGPFRIDVQPTRVVGQPQTMRPATVEHVAPGTGDLVITLPRARSISGRVRRENGTPAVGVGVMATPVGSGGEAGSRTSSEGAFVIDGLTSGPHDLTIFAPDARDGLLVVEGARADAGASDVEVVVAEGESIEGGVVDAAGKPVPGARVVAVVPGVRGGAGTTTGPDGAFRIRGLAPGSRRDLRVYTGRSGEPSAEANGVAAGTKNVRLTLR